MAQVRGLPLLSSPPPQMSAGDACRKCNKEFNMFLNRSRKCNHCGYLYCHNCSDYQAMMRRGGQEAGYDPMHVCAFCIEFLNITAAGRSMLKHTPLSKLRKYMDAYNLEIGGIVEKDDLIDAIIRARRPNGCLSQANESYYRRYSVPDKSTTHSRPRFFGRSEQTPNPSPGPRPSPSNLRTTHFPRPDLAPDSPPHQWHTPPGGPPPSHPSSRYSFSPRPPPSQPATPPPPRPHGYPRYQRPSASRSSENLNRPAEHTPPPRQRAASVVPPPALPPPTLDELINMSDEAIKALSINALKSILFTNHVNARMILEKSELVAKVKALVADELHERERQREREEVEAAEAIERQRERQRATSAREEREVEFGGEPKMDATNAVWAATNEAGVATNEAAADERGSRREGVLAPEIREPFPAPEIVEPTAPSTSAPPPPPPPKTPPTARGTAADLERTGLCVICQDEEANIAIVDCGHLAMCRGCSDLIMASSRECPLCRTRIITDSRLLRIFKT